MKKIALSSKWQMKGNGYDIFGTIPGSVYSFLLENNLVGDPYYRNNELQFLELMEHTYEFSNEFDWEETGTEDTVLLHCDGLDTLCELYLNDKKFAYTDNMHRTYEFDVTDLLKVGKNKITARFLPINPYIKERHEKNPMRYFPFCLKGFTHIRKAHCMTGWDWGPMLPDAGIWRDIYFLVENSARIKEVHITQRHAKGEVFVTPCVLVKGNAQIKAELLSPDGKVFELKANEENKIDNPLLWWPNGLGEQPLYTVIVTLTENGETVDTCTKKIGLRSLELVREKDGYGESFYHKVNGVPFFAMGGDYIPEDNIMARITPERSEKLLRHCKECNFNTIRIWGGGYYPDDWFFDLCDELGIMLFFDLMFACVMIPTHKEFEENISIEVAQNLKRIRHHACIAVISGNNEIEEAMFYPIYTDEQKSEYIRIFEEVFRNIEKEICPYIPYVPSSPSTCGHFIDPGNENYGDSHYWDVWHKNEPFKEYRNHYFRYLSEFGFQSFPCEKTVNQFTLPEDRNIFSRVMECHQKSGVANKKILAYLADTYKYPSDFGVLLYASQLLQAEAIKYGVEHLRRHRGRCMGALYWQINDIWPVASWASIDYYGRFKALQYAAKRFYAPVIISCMETGETDTRSSVNLERSVYGYETKAQLCLTNDTFDAVTGVVRWALRNSDAEVIKSGKETVSVDSFSVKWLEEMDFDRTDVNNNYMSYEYEVDGTVVSEGTVLFTAPKYFEFKNPNLTCKVDGNKITVYADAYARMVEIYSPDSDFVLSDNYFDMNAGEKIVEILEGTPKTIVLRSVYDIR